MMKRRHKIKIMDFMLKIQRKLTNSRSQYYFKNFKK